MKFKSKIAVLFGVLFFALFAGCQTDEVHNDATHETQETIKVSLDELLALLKDKDIKKAILDNKRKTKSNEEYYFTKVHMPEYDTYTLLLETYTQETPYYKFFIVTVDNNIEKSNGISETGFYALYSPEEENYDPLRGFDIGKFIGTLNILNLDQNVVGSGTISYGLATGIVTICNTSMAITEMTCSHSGEHGVGDTCSPPLINDAYYVQIEVLTTCFERRVFIAGATGGATGAPSPSAGTKFLNGLSPEDKAFLDANIEVRSSVLIYLESTTDSEAEADAFAHEMISITKEYYDEYGALGNDELNALRMLRETKLKAYFTSPWDANYYKMVDTYSVLDMQNQAVIDPWQQYFSVKVAILKHQHPDWSDWKVYWHASKEMIHIGLDLIGLVPVVGEVADLTNGVIYTIEGDGMNAALSYSSAIPVAGWAAAGVKMAKTASGLFITVKAGSNLFEFGARNSKKFRKLCGLAPGNSAFQAHHLISRAQNILDHPVVQKAAGKVGFHIDSAYNGIAVAAWRNQPNHNLYNNRILEKLEDFNTANPNATSQQCYNALMNIITQAKSAIVNNPNVHLNDLIF